MVVLRTWRRLSSFVDDSTVVVVVAVVALVVIVDDVVVIVVVFDEMCLVSMEQDQCWMMTSAAVVDEDFEEIASCHCLRMRGTWRHDPVSDSFLSVRSCYC